MNNFSEIINRYAAYADDSYFNDDRLDIKNLEDLYKSLNGEVKPFTFIYVMLNGKGNVIMNPFVNRKGMKDEEIYKKCIYENKTWKELLQYKEPSKNQLL